MFGERARWVGPAELESLEWDYSYGSNLAGALDLALARLEDEPGRIVVVTDLVATSHDSDEGDAIFSFPPSPDTTEKTVEAVRRWVRAEQS